MRKGFLFVLALLLSFTQLAVSQNLRPFVGTWKMDPARSESGHREVPIDAITLVIRLKGDALTMETTRRDGGKNDYHEKLTFKDDGSETVQKGNAGITVTSKSHWDGSSLVLETSRQMNGSMVGTVYVHTLSPDGKEMTMDKTLNVEHVHIADTAGHGADTFIRTGK
jgi:hypothetical protein